MQFWENKDEIDPSDKNEEKKDAYEGDFTVKDDTGNADGTEKEPRETEAEEPQRPVYAFENLYREAREKEMRKKKKGVHVSGGALAGIIALCLVVSILSGAFAGQFISFSSRGTEATSLTSDTVSTLASTVATAETTATATATADIPIITPSNKEMGEYLTSEQVAAKCMPSVVVIDVMTVSTYTMYGKTYESASQATGSGVVYSEDGYIITNYHVANEECTSITVTTYTGETYDAVYVMGDSESDIALIKADATGLAPVTIGSSATLAVGSYVAAIGNPLGYGLTFTDGKVSALSRTVSVEGASMTLIQISAFINQGNSGGGLFNAAGELVGIVNSKLDSVTDYSTYSTTSVDGFGFAIPIDTAIETLNDLSQYGYVRNRARLGIYRSSVYLVNNNRQYTVAARVVSVTPGGNAEAAGMQVGDIIYKIDGSEVTNSNLATLLSGHKIGDTIEITVLRPTQATSGTAVYIANCTEVNLVLTFEEFDPNVTE